MNSNSPKKPQLFTVDILLEEESNAAALEKLIRVLNSPDFKDFRIKNGIELGQRIEKALEEHRAVHQQGTSVGSSKEAGTQRQRSVLPNIANPSNGSESAAKQTAPANGNAAAIGQRDAAAPAASSMQAPAAQQDGKTAAKAGGSPAAPHSPQPAEALKVNVQPAESSNKAIVDLIQFFKTNQTLLRLKALKGKGVKINIPCRVLNFDPDTENVSVYHVDEKRVYLFKLTEIEDLSV